MAEKEYIERDEAYKIINEAMTAGMVNIFSIQQRRANFEEVLEVIEEIPAADVQEVRHGQWQKHYKSGTTVSDGFVSSCCDMWNERETPYCPYCGTRMDGDDND